jgi:AcrR family transcriptional regulator
MGMSSRDRQPGRGKRPDRETEALSGQPGHHFRNSIWSRRRDANPRGQPSLSYDAIVQAAIELADEGGPAAISMRKIAAKLRVGTMSLYWYVPSKDDLMDLVLDAVRGEIDLPHPVAGDWRQGLAEFARNTRTVMLRHPWMVSFASSGPPVGPNSLKMVEAALGYFDAIGVDIKTAIYSSMTVDTYVSGAVIRELQEMEAEHLEQGEKAFDQDSEIVREFVAYLAEYPRIREMIGTRLDPDSPESRDERFEFGLECVLDGIAVRVAAGMKVGSASPGDSSLRSE